MSDIKLVPAFATAILHGVVIAFLLFGMPNDNRVIQVKAKPLAIQAKLVMEKSVSRPAEPPPRKPIPKPVAKAEANLKPVKKSEPKLEVKPAPKPIPKGPTPEEIRKKKAEEEARDKAKQAVLQEEISKQQQKDLADALAYEDDLVEEGELASTYVDLIAALIGQNWSLPPTARNGMKATVQIITIPTGEIVGHQVIKGSGNPAFDLSAIRAITKLGRIDELGALYKIDPSAYEKRFRRFNFDFVPQDLRR